MLYSNVGLHALMHFGYRPQKQVNVQQKSPLYCKFKESLGDGPDLWSLWITLRGSEDTLPTDVTF